MRLREDAEASPLTQTFRGSLTVLLATRRRPLRALAAPFVLLGLESWLERAGVDGARAPARPLSPAAASAAIVAHDLWPVGSLGGGR